MHVEILQRDQRVALHRRVSPCRRFVIVTDPAHMPTHHPAYAYPKIMQRAAAFGTATAELIEILFAKRRHPEQATRGAQGGRPGTGARSRRAGARISLRQGTSATPSAMSTCAGCCSQRTRRTNRTIAKRRRTCQSTNQTGPVCNFGRAGSAALPAGADAIPDGRHKVWTVALGRAVV